MQLPQLGRRAKPLKATSTIADLSDLLIVSPADGDLLVYKSSDQLWHNSKALTGAYTVTGSLTATTLAATGALSAASLAISGSATIGANLTVTGTLAAGASTLASLTVSGNASVTGTLTVTGTLAFAGFSISGSGTIGGSLTVGTTLSVTGAVTLSSTLTVAGNTAISGLLVVTGAGFFAQSLTVTGAITSGSAITGASLGASGNISGGGTLTLGSGAVYTDNGITFADDGTSIDILNGTATIISLRTASIKEGTGDPNGVITSGPGSLFLRTDGYSPVTVYYKTRGTDTINWVPIQDFTSQIDELRDAILQIVDVLADNDIQIDLDL